MATVLRTDGDLRTTEHCAISTLTPFRAGGVLFPTTAYRYGLQAAGPTRQREPGGRQNLTSRTRGRPASKQAVHSSLGVRAPLNR